MAWPCPRCGAGLFGNVSTCFKCGEPVRSPDQEAREKAKAIPRISGEDLSKAKYAEYIIRDQVKELSKFIEKRGDVQHALLLAARCGSAEAVRLLIASGADLRAKEFSGTVEWTALELAAARGDEAIVQLLIEAPGGQEILKRYGGDALWLAASAGQASTVKALASAGVHLEGKGPYGTSLTRAAENGHREVVKALIELGADINAGGYRGKTALMEAAANGHADIVRDLVESGAAVNQKDEYHDTAIMIAGRTGHSNIVEILKVAGAISDEVTLADVNALRDYMQALAREWWSKARKVEAVCDVCNKKINSGEGYLIGSYLKCEGCCGLGPDALVRLNADQNHFGIGVLDAARKYCSSVKR